MQQVSLFAIAGKRVWSAFPNLMACAGVFTVLNGFLSQLESAAPLERVSLDHSLGTVVGGSPACLDIGFSSRTYCSTGGTVEPCGWACADCLSNCSPVTGESGSFPTSMARGSLVTVGCETLGSFTEHRWCGFFCSCSGGVIAEFPCSFREAKKLYSCINSG